MKFNDINVTTYAREFDTIKKKINPKYVRKTTKKYHPNGQKTEICNLNTEIYIKHAKQKMKLNITYKLL